MEHIFPKDVLYLQRVCLVILLQCNCFPAENYSSEVTLGTITANYSFALEFKGSPATLPPSHLEAPALEHVVTAARNCSNRGPKGHCQLRDVQMHLRFSC